MSSVPLKLESTSDVSASIGKGVDIKETIIHKGTVRIDGSLEGEVQTEGILCLVGEGAFLKTKVTAGTAVCKGKITGDVTATEKIRLRAPAVLSGGVKAPILSIEERVPFNSTIEMTHSS